MGKIARIFYEGNLRTSNLHIRSGKCIITDAPVDNNGQGRAFSPTDLVATALGNCMLTVMGIYADKNNINLDGISAEITKEMASNPRRIAKVIVDIYFPEITLDQKQRSSLENVALTCPVIKSLSEKMEKDVTFNYV